MRKTGIIVADATRARFITFEHTEHPDLDGKDRCVEHGDLVNPESRVAPREQFSDRPSRKPGPHGGYHLSDDHRQAHQDEVERRFSKRILDAAQPFVEQHGLRRLLLIAAPRLLGALRAELEGRRLSDVQIVEMSEDHSRQSLSQIAELVVKRQLLRGATSAVA
jgi:protein required for attachment to host cells